MTARVSRDDGLATPELLAGLDAELRLALRSGWQDHPGGDSARVFLRRLDQTTQWPDCEVLWETANHATAVVGRRSLKTFSGLAKGFEVGLAEPIAPSRRTRPLDVPPVRKPCGASRQERGRSSTLLGVIDDGCPFAHSSLRRSGTPGTRVVALWDQNPPAAAQTARVKYGREWGRDDLDQVMSDHADPATGAIDEAACYQATGFDCLAHRWTHGAHVVGRLAGSDIWQAGRHTNRAGAIPAEDEAATSDIAFVQLPHDALVTVSTAAIAFHAFNGIAYLIELAKDLGYPRLVIALAYDSWLGPHDGSSWFEDALDELIEQSNKDNFEVRVVLAAGNSARQSGHVELDRPGKGSHEGEPVPLHLYLAPDSELPTWVELWLPSQWFAAAAALTLAVGAPAHVELVGNVSLSSDSVWTNGHGRDIMLAVFGANPPRPKALRRRVLLRFAPTRAMPGCRCAPHGVWTLTVTSTGRPVRDSLQGNAYVGRAGRLMYQTVLARQSHFAITLKQDLERTLSGLAGGENVIVAGSRYPEKFPYDGSLPTRFGMPDEVVVRGEPTGYSGSPATSKRGDRLVDAYAETEDGLLLPGQIGMATRSGGVWRMSGTSVAVPTIARRMANCTSWGTGGPGKLPKRPSRGVSRKTGGGDGS